MGSSCEAQFTKSFDLKVDRMRGSKWEKLMPGFEADVKAGAMTEATCEKLRS